MPSRDVTLCCSLIQAALPGVISELEAVVSGVYAKPIQTMRTVEEQQALYASGRTKPGPWRTNADGVEKLSRHQKQVLHGEDAVHAVDLGIFTGNFYLTKDVYYRPLAMIAPGYGLVSGWSFPPIAKADPDHLQCNPALVISPAPSEEEK